MNSHNLAKILLTLPDIPMATHADGHDWFSSEGDLIVGMAKRWDGDFIMVGNMGRMDLNSPNWYLSRVLYGPKLPENYPYQRSGRCPWVFPEPVDEFSLK